MEWPLLQQTDMKGNIKSKLKNNDDVFNIVSRPKYPKKLTSL
jgi:hypothetical protein